MMWIKVEKLFSARQRCKARNVSDGPSRGGSLQADLGNGDELLDRVRTLLQVVLAEDRFRDPASDLQAGWSEEEVAGERKEGRTQLDRSIILLMLGASDPYSFGQALPRHSCGVIFAKRSPSMSVSWRASSSGSMSMNLSFRRLRGMIDGGRIPGARFPP